MLSIAEEILLLALDDETGKLSTRLPVHSLRNAVSGALLMDLAFENRIDTDLHRLIVIDTAPLGEFVLDDVLARIAKEEEDRETGHWVNVFAGEYETFLPRALDRLVERGILSQREGRLSWLIGVRRYPTVDDRPQHDVKQRIMDTLLTDVIPDPRDIAIICLADACALWRTVIDERDLADVRPRIEQIVKMDLIGQSVTRTIRELQDAARGVEAKWFR